MSWFRNLSIRTVQHPSSIKVSTSYAPNNLEARKSEKPNQAHVNFKLKTRISRQEGVADDPRNSFIQLLIRLPTPTKALSSPNEDIDTGHPNSTSRINHTTQVREKNLLPFLRAQINNLNLTSPSPNFVQAKPSQSERRMHLQSIQHSPLKNSFFCIFPFL